MRKGLWLVLVSALCSLLLAGAASAGPLDATGPAATSIDSLAASVASGRVSVSGHATFVDVPVQVGDDGSGDATPADIGADITTLTISRAPSTNKFSFDMDIADMLPGTNTGLPIFVFYTWGFTVTAPDGTSADYLLVAGAGSATAPTTPWAQLVTCTQGTTGGSCTAVNGGVSSSKVANGVVEWQVPANKLASPPRGSTLSESSDGIATVTGVAAAGAWQEAGLKGVPDSASADDAFVPGQQVLFGIAPAGTDPATVNLGSSANLKSDGSFTGSVTAPSTAGSYELVAQACYTADDCVLQTSNFTV